MTYEIVGHFGGTGKATQHVRAVGDDSTLPCGLQYSAGQFFFVDRTESAKEALDASGSKEINCQGCRRELEALVKV